MKKTIKILAVTFLLAACNTLFADEKTTTSVSVTNTTSPASGTTVTESTTTTTSKTNEMDEKIVSAIYAKFANDSALIGTTLTVMSKDGVVTLNGTVTAQAQADEAVIAAKSIPNVKDVKSQINVTTNPQNVQPFAKKPMY